MQRTRYGTGLCTGKIGALYPRLAKGEIVAKNQFHAFFEALGRSYLDEGFAQNTVAEVDFLLQTLDIEPGQCILDMGCGPGRHAIELARLGYRVTGVDYTRSFLQIGREMAAEAGVQVEFICQDAREFTRIRAYDAAICICEGAFGLLQRDEDNLRILRNIADALKPGANFVLTTLNGYRAIRSAPRQNAADHWFDSLRCLSAGVYELEGKRYQGLERAYIVPELLKMHAAVGLEVRRVYGGTAGKWGSRELDLDEMEVMLISRRIESPWNRGGNQNVKTTD